MTLHRLYRWELLGLLCLAFFLHQADRAIFGVVLPSIREDLGLSNREVGTIGTVLFLALAVMMPIAGYAGDVFNRKWVVTGSLLFWSTATMLTGLTHGLLGLILLRSVATAWGESFYAPAAYPLMAAFHKSTRTIAMSIHQASLYVAMMVSGVVAGWIAAHWGWRSAFFLYGGCGILLGGVFVFRLRNATSPPGEQAPPTAQRVTPGEALGVLIRRPTALLITTSFTAVVLANNAYVVWAPTFLWEKFGLSMVWAGGLAMVCQYMASMLGVIVGGLVSDRMAPKHPGFRLRWQSGFMLLCAPAILVMGLGGRLAISCCGIVALGLCQGLYQSNTPASLFDVIPPRYRSSALGVQIMLAFLVGSASPWLLGQCREIWGAGQGLSYGFAALSGTYAVGGLAMAAAIFTFGRDRCTEPS